LPSRLSHCPSITSVELGIDLEELASRPYLYPKLSDKSVVLRRVASVWSGRGESIGRFFYEVELIVHHLDFIREHSLFLVTV
jgi:hypothetical protein